MKRVLKVVLIIGMIAFIAYGGLCVYANVSPASKDHAPALSEAPYTVHLMTTGRVILTKSYEHIGTKYIVRGYWEQVKGRYMYRPLTLTLDTATFGPIQVGRRTQ